MTRLTRCLTRGFWVGGLCLLAGSAFGQAYQVNTFGTKQVGMGHTGTALPQDGATIAFNPAGMSFIRNSVTLGFSPVNVQSSYVDKAAFGTTYETDNDWATPFNAYAVWGPDASPLKFGLGVYTPFGGGYDWGTQWIGADDLNSLDLSAIYFQPTVSYRIGEQFSLGASFIYALGNVNLKRSIPQVNYPDGSYGQVELDSDADGFGFMVGAYWQPTEQWSFGLSYRSLVTAKAEGGDANFTVPASVRSNFPTGNTFDAELPLPAQLALGVAYRPDERWAIALDLNYIFWSEYENLTFDFARDASNTTTPAGQPISVVDQVQPRNYDDAWAIRLGAQYELLEDVLIVRAGSYYSHTPIQDGFVTAESPDNNRITAHVGLTWMLNENFDIDAAFQYLRVLEREDNNPATGLNGTWNTQAFIPSIGLTYKFGE